ncbi:hypothetical protein [Stenotrophomonas mori]|uniref:Secreted protein n=1 Tax=Stenotrophomonas mori TaxID=2871096 RepID=A0ABT0SDK4_9GAMM|nr:hypothetical protein [Stenotrophomonas mori]MCL7713347.1 hypothetical protein [Stenotrophomonas mori]
MTARFLLGGLLPLLAAAVPSAATAATDSGAVAATPPAQFMAALARYCGQAFAGRIVVDRPASTAPDPFQGKVLVMHVRGCEAPEQTLRVPFHVGDDRSRTWVISRVGPGLRLKHDHRQADGPPEPVTLYGGDTRGAGTARRQVFPADAESVALFEREGMAASTHNAWAMEIEPGRRFVYELARPDGRLFRVEFDLAHPLPAPPPPWGDEAVGATQKGA